MSSSIDWQRSCVLSSLFALNHACGVHVLTRPQLSPSTLAAEENSLTHIEADQPPPLKSRPSKIRKRSEKRKPIEEMVSDRPSPTHVAQFDDLFDDIPLITSAKKKEVPSPLPTSQSRLSFQPWAEWKRSLAPDSQKLLTDYQQFVGAIDLTSNPIAVTPHNADAISLIATPSAPSAMGAISPTSSVSSAGSSPSMEDGDAAMFETQTEFTLSSETYAHPPQPLHHQVVPLIDPNNPAERERRRRQRMEKSLQQLSEKAIAEEKVRLAELAAKKKTSIISKFVSSQALADELKKFQQHDGRAASSSTSTFLPPRRPSSGATLTSTRAQATRFGVQTSTRPGVPMLSQAPKQSQSQSQSQGVAEGRSRKRLVGTPTESPPGKKRTAWMRSQSSTSTFTAVPHELVHVLRDKLDLAPLTMSSEETLDHDGEDDGDDAAHMTPMEHDGLECDRFIDWDAMKAAKVRRSFHQPEMSLPLEHLRPMGVDEFTTDDDPFEKLRQDWLHSGQSSIMMPIARMPSVPSVMPSTHIAVTNAAIAALAKSSLQQAQQASTHATQAAQAHVSSALYSAAPQRSSSIHTHVTTTRSVSSPLTVSTTGFQTPHSHSINAAGKNRVYLQPTQSTTPNSVSAPRAPVSRSTLQSAAPFARGRSLLAAAHHRASRIAARSISPHGSVSRI